MASERDTLLQAWIEHQAFGTRLTEKYRKALAKKPPRMPTIGPFEGKREADALVEADAAFARLYGLSSLEVSRGRIEGLHMGLTREEALDRMIPTDNCTEECQSDDSSSDSDPT